MATTRTYQDVLRERGPLTGYRVVKVERADRILTLTLNEPEALNSYSARMTGELRRALGEAAEDPDVRVVILTGAGKAFSAGGDMRMMRAGDLPPAELHEFVRVEFGGLIHGIAAMDKPVIAAVNGYAMGVACFTVLACDLVVLSERARLGTAYIHLGLSPLGVGYLLAKAVGYARAYELCALGDVLDARRAEALGLVNRVAPHERLMDEARALATRLAQGPPRALGFTKRLLRQAVQADLDEHLAAGEAIQPLLLWTDDHKETVSAFGEKRPPRFTGR